METGSFVKRSLSVWREGCAASLGTDEKAKLGFSAPLGLAPQALGEQQPRFRGEAVSLGPWAGDPGPDGTVRWQPVHSGFAACVFSFLFLNKDMDQGT